MNIAKCNYNYHSSTWETEVAVPPNLKPRWRSVKWQKKLKPQLTLFSLSILLLSQFLFFDRPWPKQKLPFLLLFLSTKKPSFPSSLSLPLKNSFLFVFSGHPRANLPPKKILSSQNLPKATFPSFLFSSPTFLKIKTSPFLFWIELGYKEKGEGIPLHGEWCVPLGSSLYSPFQSQIFCLFPRPCRQLPVPRFSTEFSAAK